MLLKEIKCDYQIFTRSRQEFASCFIVNNTHIERKYVTKMLGMWIKESGKWTKNTAELCKQAFCKISMLTKLKYAGTSIADLLEIYKLFIRS